MNAPPTPAEIEEWRLDEVRKAAKKATANDDDVDADASPVLCAADIEPKLVRWLWKGRIALGMMNILDGLPGLGKSTITADLAARVSRGLPAPGETVLADPSGVVFVSFEESTAEVMVPRLMAAGADLKRIHIWNLAAHAFTLTESLAELAAVIRHTESKLVIVDPFMAALPSEVNAHRDQDVRRVLAPVSALAEATGSAVLFVRHLNKAAGAPALLRGGGSIGIIGAMRCGLLLGEDGDSGNETARILATTKCNVGRPAPALRLRLAAAPPPVPGAEVAIVIWEGAVTHTADELLVPQEERSAMSDAVKLICELLMDGPITAAEGIKALEANGISERTAKRARSKLGVKASRAMNKGCWYWSLPDQRAK